MNIFVDNNNLEQSRIFLYIQISIAFNTEYIHQKKVQMLDWQGLLKFTLKNCDGTNKSNFKEMPKEDKQFLEEVLGQYCNSEIKRIKEIFLQLQKPEESLEEERLNLLENLQELLDSLDKGNVLFKMNGHLVLLNIIFFSKFNSNKIVALQIFSSANQNDAAIQTESINCGALEFVQLIKKEENMKVKQNLMTGISSMLRGENLQAKRIFIRLGGLNLLKFILENEPSQRLNSKINVLWRDLLYYDEYLHQTYKDLSSFSNTNGLKSDNKKGDLKYDVNEQNKLANVLPQNQKYRGYIAKFFQENKSIRQNYGKWLQKQEKQ